MNVAYYVNVWIVIIKVYYQSERLMTDSQDEALVQMDPGDVTADIYPRAIYSKESHSNRQVF